jgi:hypothetical protein
VGHAAERRRRLYRRLGRSLPATPARGSHPWTRTLHLPLCGRHAALAASGRGDAGCAGMPAFGRPSPLSLDLLSRSKPRQPVGCRLRAAVLAVLAPLRARLGAPGDCCSRALPATPARGSHPWTRTLHLPLCGRHAALAASGRGDAGCAGMPACGRPSPLSLDLLSRSKPRQPVGCRLRAAVLAVLAPLRAGPRTDGVEPARARRSMLP